jgi:hypothetical protein
MYLSVKSIRLQSYTLFLFSLFLHFLIFQYVRIGFPQIVSAKPHFNFLGAFLDQKDFAGLDAPQMPQKTEQADITVRSQKSSFNPQEVTAVAKPVYLTSLKKKSKKYKKFTFLNQTEIEEHAPQLPPLNINQQPPRPKLKLYE